MKSRAGRVQPSRRPWRRQRRRGAGPGQRPFVLAGGPSSRARGPRGHRARYQKRSRANSPSGATSDVTTKPADFSAAVTTSAACPRTARCRREQVDVLCRSGQHSMCDECVPTRQREEPVLGRGQSKPGYPAWNGSSSPWVGFGPLTPRGRRVQHLGGQAQGVGPPMLVSPGGANTGLARAR